MRGDVDNIVPEIRGLLKRLQLFYEPWEAYAWLAMPHPLLNGKTPVQIIQDGQTHLIEQLLSQLEDGAYL